MVEISQTEIVAEAKKIFFENGSTKLWDELSKSKKQYYLDEALDRLERQRRKTHGDSWSRF